jgi:hypothetical protein
MVPPPLMIVTVFDDERVFQGRIRLSVSAIEKLTRSQLTRACA